MSVTRPNILKDSTTLKKYCDGVNRLKNEFTGPATQDLGIDGPAQPVSTYDLFVVWHVNAMMTPTPAHGNPEGRNAAHRGPVFAPWHRFMLRQLELNLQRVLGDQNFGLPYWDWAADGEGSPQDQLNSPLWTPDGIGGSGAPITTGPFVFDPGDDASFRVRIDTDSNGNFEQVNRGLERTLGQDIDTLPRKADTATALQLTPYDGPPWTVSSSGFRNQLEGWTGSDGPGMHNRVHVWIGGDMGPASSPNDPVFFLNHCNVDRIWEAWMQQNGRTYVPDQNAPASLQGHRIDDQLYSLISPPVTPADVLDVTAQYVYDSLNV
ncbi:MAG TPA: tyrosinase family protein [Candidatus Saccharimonadales bacterium]|jgi:tyrosinase|nr:tyrosinase family protein [Candidatus Saccharimonadales bacterium]